MFIFMILALLVCRGAQGTSTVTPVFVQTGKDLFLDVMEHVALQEGSDLTWRLNGVNNIAKFSFDANKTRMSGSYKGRAEMFLQNHSLLLKNVQKSDSGGYTAYVSGDKDEPVAKYEVTVQDPVSPVELTVNSSSSDSCNLTVTCSTKDSLISSTFRCDNQTCSQEGGERSEAQTYPSSINVYLQQGFIICNHSNHVSWRKDIQMIDDFCPQHAGSESVSAGVSVCLVKTVVLSAGLIIMVSAVISVHIMAKVKKQK